MSSSNKSTSRGGKGSKAAESGGKSQAKTDSKTDTGNKSNKSQSSSNETRLAQIMDRKSDCPSINDQVQFVMETTCKSEEEVCLVLHDCDYDIDKAVNLLLESSSQSAFATSVKKKKSRQASTSKTETADGGGGGVEDWDAATQPNAGAASGIQASGNATAGGNERERSRNRGGPRLSKGRGDSRGWRGREGRDGGERNQDDRSEHFNNRRGGRMSNGPGRGGGGSGRGGRGGRSGPRTYQSRDGGSRSHTRNTVETWEDPSTTSQNGMKKRNINNNDSFPQPEEWDNEEYRGTLGAVETTWEDTFPQPEDWDNEEYTGSLADTKVFTPSQAMEAAAVAAANAAAEANTITAENVSTIESQNVPDLASAVAVQQMDMSSIRGQQQTQHDLRQPVHLQQPQSNTLSAAQTQYLNQLTQQSSENMKAAAAAAAAAISAQQVNSSGYQSAGTPYSSQGNTYGSQTYGQATNTYGNPSLQDSQSVQSQPARQKTQRARVPPPSKIPASAVEMPGDLNTSIGFLDVQFGGMDLVSDNSSFDDTTCKYSTGLDNTTQSTQQSSLEMSASLNPNSGSSIDTFSTNAVVNKQSVAQANISAALGQNQILSNNDSISQTSADHLASQTAYSSSRNVVQSSNNSLQSTIDTVKGADVLSHNTYSQQPSNSYQSYQSQKSSNSTYQTPSGYNANSYSSNAQVTSTSTYSSNQPANSYSSSNTNSAYNQSTVNNSYGQTSSYSTTSAYQNVAPAFSSMSNQASSFPTNQGSTGSGSGYQTSNPNQSVYAPTAAAINNSNSYPNQYNSYPNVTNNHKLTGTSSSTKDQVQYDNVNTQSVSNVTANTAVNSNNTIVSSNNATPTLAALSQTTSASTKVTTTSTAKSGVVPNIPPGVAPMMGGQYIMGQAGVPFYQQPVYSFEDIQIIQQRIPHMTTGYYDIPAYQQAPTSLATGGDRALASVAYSMSNDGRFTRADNNASPVPSTISQQISTTTQAHQAQPMLNATALPPGYAYFYNTGMMPGSYQYGTTAIYPQMPAAANAHGSTTSSQYPKPGSYGSGYNSGYDALSQTQDYNKSAYVGGPNQSQNKTGVAVTTGSSATDLSSMYGKSHAALGKVNSYDKQAFHSGTPPPFNLAGSQSGGLAPTGQYAPHLFIPTIAPHQTHHNTTLMHQPLHQMDVRQTNRRTDSSNSSGQRSQTSSQAKPGSKPTYQTSYWNQA